MLYFLKILIESIRISTNKLFELKVWLFWRLNLILGYIKVSIFFQGFSIVTILHNDVSNGIIGFSESSKALTVNEDTAPTFTLQLSRINAYFGEVEVSLESFLSLFIIDLKLYRINWVKWNIKQALCESLRSILVVI